MVVRNRFVKSQALDVAAELAQRIEPFRRATAGILHQIIEPILAGDHNKMRDAARQPYPHDDGISAGEIRIDQLIRCQVFIHVPHPVGSEPRGAVPVKPTLFGVSRRRKSKTSLTAADQTQSRKT